MTTIVDSSGLVIYFLVAQRLMPETLGDVAVKIVEAGKLRRRRRRARVQCRKGKRETGMLESSRCDRRN